MLKRFLKATALVVGLASFCYADSQVVGGGHWGGLNDGDASIFIGAGQAKSLLNVDLTPNAFGIRKRDGYTLFKTVGVSTTGIRGGYYFRDVNANNVVIHANDRAVYKSVNGSAYSAIATTDTRGAYYDFSDSQGKLWRADSSNDEIFSYDGSTLLYYPSLPKGTQLEITPTRLVVAGTTANPNRVNYSQSADFTNFTVGTDDTSPFFEDLGLPGQKIQAIKYANGRVLAWTKDTFSEITADGPNDLSPTRDISTTVGTVQPNSVVYDGGIVYWQGQDRHFYAYDFNQVIWLSRPISNTVASLASGDSKSWTLTTQADWGAGTFGSGLSSTTAPGDLRYDPEVSQTNYNSSEVIFPLAQSFQLSQAAIIYGGTLYGERIQNEVVTIRTNSGNAPASVILATYTETNSAANSLVAYTFQFDSPVSLSANTTYWLYVNDPDNADVLHDSNANPYSSGQLWRNGTSIPANDLYFELFSASAAYQQTYNIGTAITGWGSLDISQTLTGTGDSITYAVYGDTNAALTISNPLTFVSSQAITSGGIPSIATAAYLTLAASFSHTKSTQTPALNQSVLTWFEGNITRTFGSVDKDHRIIWSVAEATQTVPNISLVFDPRYKEWLKYSAPMDAPAKVGDYLYFGNPSSGNVYKYPSGNTDNGSGITAYWQSADFVTPDATVEKDYTKISLIAKAQTGSNLDLSYIIDTSSTSSTNLSLTDPDGNSFRRYNYNIPHGRFGTFFSVRFGNDDGDAPFEVYSISYEYKPRLWRVLP